MGINDPFPNDQGSKSHGLLTVPESAYDFVYPEIRLDEDRSPATIFIPTKELMFKLMRASIGVKAKEELWFN